MKKNERSFYINKDEKIVSATAEYMAFFRAIETAKGKEAIFSDPLAADFLDKPSRRLMVRLSGIGFVRSAIIRVIDSYWPGARSSGIARTRLIDDLLSPALSEREIQAVILGSGFDSRAYRIPRIGQVTVFEVDHPVTQKRKISRLAKCGWRKPLNLRLLEIDFEKQTLDDVLS
ncbi:MAG TPA: class I SAM-dependent methyltransferase, partial [Blastocatellia bacterium]|nr:class I SAM-dependent methyltransferase [Blastocatellia bacterium]